MPFCTSCGAQVKGAFCEQCGTPVNAATAAPPQPPVSPVAQGVTPAAAPVQRKTSPLVWILVALGTLFVLGMIALIGAGLFVRHLAENPGLALGKLITAANPDAEIVSTDTGGHTITFRDKRTGEEFTMSFDDVKNGKFKMKAIGRNGEVANVEMGGGAAKLPSWVPAYPGARAQGNFTATGEDGSGRGAGGVVTFESTDSPEKVMDFYKDKVAGMGMKVITTFGGTDGGMMVAQDEDEKRTLQVTVGKSGSGSTIGLTFGEKR